MGKHNKDAGTALESNLCETERYINFGRNVEGVSFRVYATSTFILNPSFYWLLVDLVSDYLNFVSK